MRIRTLAPTLAAILLWASAVSAPAQADNYPSQNIKLIIPFGAGGPNDIIARPLTQKITESIGQAFVIENRPGGNGIVGTNAVAKAAPDGYMMLQTTGSFSANPSMVKNLPYEPMRDLAPISLLAESYGLLLMVPANSPIKSLADVVEIAKKDPNKLNYAITGFGNITHVTVEFFKHIAGIKITPIPYKGTADSITAMLSGQVDMSIVSTVAGTPYLANKQLRALGITGARRAPTLPEVPTFQELGFKEMNLAGYYGWWFPGGTPRERVEFMSREVKKALQAPEIRKVVSDSGLDAVGSTPDEFRDYLLKDIAFQADVLKRIGIEPK